MIEFKSVFIQYVKEFYSLYDFSCVINSHTLFVGDFFDGTVALMRTLAKIDKHYAGDIFIDNVNLKNIKDKDLSVAYLPEKPFLFKNKNIFKNLYFPLKIRKINKNTAKNLIYSVFFELKKENFNFLDNYLNNKNNNKNFINEEFLKLKIENILKLKVKKLNLSEQKIIALIRAVVRNPKYLLLEDFFEDFDNDYVPLAEYLINKLKRISTIISCEKDETKVELFKDFKNKKLSTENKEKKED
ncbi:MAG: ATP-binding cassette domain-containing protein [Clostridia bacterium]|nr:ATP-binding cassette domain-containing protein [Clostridia bacterium]